VDIQVYSTLRDIVGGKSVSLNVAAPMALAELLEQLFAVHPALRTKVLSAEGELQPSVHILINGREARHLDGLQTRIAPEDSVRILPPVGGGRPMSAGFVRRYLMSSTDQPRRAQAPFFPVGLVADRGQPGMGHHRERDVTMPTVPVAHFILIQAGFAFGFLNTLLDRVAGGSHLTLFDFTDAIQ
jgi:molybdopterin synthase sulfur carrier subunit